MSYHVNRKKTVTMLRTILPLLPPTVIIELLWCKIIIHQ